jgi:hypothetical protein
VKKYLLYPWGAGGYWLRHLLSTAAQGLKEMSLPTGQNFHATPPYQWLELTHFLPPGPYFVLSDLCKFNLYLNTTYKLRLEDNFNGFCNQEPWQQIFELGDDANWRLAQAYVETFETHIDIHYKNIMRDPAQLRTDLLTLDLPQTVLENLTLDLVTQSCAAFTKRCPDTAEHVGNVDSLAWQGWCQGLAVHMSIEIPVKIDQNLMGYKQWLKENNQLFIDFTKPYIL